MVYSLGIDVGSVQAKLAVIDRDAGVVRTDTERIVSTSSVTGFFGDPAVFSDPPTTDLLKLSEKYLSPKCGSEAVLSIGGGIEWMADPEFAGVISVMPHGCMPGGIVAAMTEKLSKEYDKPWISLTYDGIQETNNRAKINDFAELIRYTSRRATATPWSQVRPRLTRPAGEPREG